MPAASKSPSLGVELCKTCGQPVRDLDRNMNSRTTWRTTCNGTSTTSRTPPELHSLRTELGENFQGELGELDTFNWTSSTTDTFNFNHRHQPTSAPTPLRLRLHRCAAHAIDIGNGKTKTTSKPSTSTVAFNNQQLLHSTNSTSLSVNAIRLSLPLHRCAARAIDIGHHLTDPVLVSLRTTDRNVAHRRGPACTTITNLHYNN